LTELRQLIDQIDNELLAILAKRMRVSREIGQYKKEHNTSIYQNARYDEILDRRVNSAKKMGMDGAFMKTIMEAIHGESIRQQMEILNQ
jgi:chorismate mutase